MEAALEIAGVGCRYRPHPGEPLFVERLSIRIGERRFCYRLVFVVGHGERSRA
jgi:hypothetical protein